MGILQPIRQSSLADRLKRNAGEIRFLPRLISQEPSLNNQPARATLTRALRNRQQIILDGAAGSGKTVLALSLATNSEQIDCAYLEASLWAPGPTDGLNEFLLAAGCDHERAMQAYGRGTLVLIIDAIDEAPWSSSGRSAPEAVVRLSEQIDGKAGLLVTSRTSRQVPELPVQNICASLGGIDPSDVEGFLAFYSRSRTGVAGIAEHIRKMPFPDQLRYSPLVLRRFAEGLTTSNLPSNVVELFESIADFYIGRECQKPKSAGAQLKPGSWQAAYSERENHRALVSILVFGTGKSGRTVSEPEFERLVRSVLRPSAFGARALVELSTLMSQHPLVVVTYVPGKTGHDSYQVECPHDWARTGLFPKFLSYDSLNALMEVLDTWQEAIPHHEDYAPAWSWLEAAGRAEETLKVLLDLSSSPDPEQAKTVAKWLAAQMFSPVVPKATVSKLFSTVCSLAARFTPAKSDLSALLELASLVPGPLVFVDQDLKLTEEAQVANFGGLSLQASTIMVAQGGPRLIFLRNCSLLGVHLHVKNDCRVHLIGCYLAEFMADISENAKLTLENCIYDPKSCSLPAVTYGLETSTPVSLGDLAESVWALAEVLRRLIVLGDKPELAKRKTNVNEHYVYGGLVSRFMDKATRILGIMEAKGYVLLKPTGPIRRVDPMGKFDACEAARYILKPSPAGSGPMTQEILRGLSRS